MQQFILKPLRLGKSDFLHLCEFDNTVLQNCFFFLKNLICPELAVIASADRIVKCKDLEFEASKLSLIFLKKIYVAEASLGSCPKSISLSMPSADELLHIWAVS